MAASEDTIQNNPSDSRKFSRETSEPEFCYSSTIGFAFPTNFAHQSETYHGTTDPPHSLSHGGGTNVSKKGNFMAL